MPKVKSFYFQAKAIFVKNMLCSLRNKEIYTEVFLPVIAALFVSLKDKDPSLTLLIFSPILISLAAYSNPRSLLIHLVEEKSEKFKETQKIMGLKQSAYVVGWLVYAYFKTIMSAIIFLCCWPLFAMIFADSNLGLWNDMPWQEFYGIYCLYAIAILNQSLFLSTFFSSPKLANEVSTFLTIIALLLPYLGFITKLQTTEFFVLASFLPQCCISFVFLSQQKELFYQLGQVITVKFNGGDAGLELTILLLFFFVMYFYLDQVFPNEYGVSKPPLFFIYGLFGQNKKKKQVYEQNDMEKGLIKQDNLQNEYEYEDTSSAYYHQKMKLSSKKLSVEIKDLSKKFGDFTAVDGLSLNLYSNQILCLLGHNGAGKTTTINVLTGLLSKTSGKVSVNGVDLEENLDDIRENFGICNQRDVLYDELTVYEQLAFMGRIKGLEGSDLGEEIKQIMRTTLLSEEQNKLTKQLSGGNKRKLSLAQALIGGSQVIFLDEPTSGMDAMSRRVIWEILEKVKQENRTLVLTTHHLDEAEVLADRIAIMAAGKLLACGKCDYIKVNFGEGYQISMTILDKQISKEQIVNFTYSQLPQAVLDPQSSESQLLYQITFKQKQYLLNYFAVLEKEFGNKISVNFKINSLEDAFINIGMDEERFIQKAKRHQLGLGDSVLQNNKSSINQNEYDNYDDQFAEQKAIIHVPECLNRSPQYIFKQQFLAIFLRKYYTTIRTFSNYLAVIIPFALIIIGTLAIGQVDFNGDTDPVYRIPKNQDMQIRQTLISIFIIIAFCFNSSIFILQPVLERETNLRYALTAMGCRDLPYWLGTFAFDYLLYLLFVILFIFMSVIMSLDFITDFLGQIFYIFFSFGISFCFFSYFMGALLYRKSSRAMKTFPFFNYFVAFGIFLDLWLIVGILFLKGEFNDPKFSDFQTYTLYFTDFLGALLSPFFNIYKTFTTLIDSRDFDSGLPIPQIAHNSYFYSTMMIFQGILFLMLTIIVESRTYNQIHDKVNNQIPYQKAQINDPQVLAEENQLQSSNKPIKVLNLQKRYAKGGIMAVKDISFGVEPNQILGLLGPSGAGKTTTFSILTSLIGKTTGSVKIKNVEIDRDQSEVFRETGVCPQFDCIWENLTPKEHLYLFGRMKGLTGKDLEESVQYFLATMQLEEYIKRKAGRLSGGNKRKLCVSNALIGGPSIQFFDEPSTGVDPIARRFLWKTLKQGVKMRVSSVVLTTHTMDEAESLCDRIAIMINGELYCLGSPKELKDRYGEGYNIQLKGCQNGDSLLQQMQKMFPSSRRIPDNSEDYFTVHIPTQEFRFFRVFDLMMEFEKNKQIHDFSINQSSLESVFIQFSRLQQQVSYT